MMIRDLLARQSAKALLLLFFRVDDMNIEKSGKSSRTIEDWRLHMRSAIRAS